MLREQLVAENKMLIFYRLLGGNKVFDAIVKRKNNSYNIGDMVNISDDNYYVMARDRNSNNILVLLKER